MSDDRLASALLTPADYGQQSPLQRLLADVQRIAQAAEALRAALPDTPTRPAAPQIEDTDIRQAATLVHLLRQFLEEARNKNLTMASVPRGLLRDAIWRLEELLRVE